MFDEKTILARLQNGEDAQKIADEMAATLNQANKAYEDQKAAEEAAKKQNEVQKKKEDLQQILDLFYDWFHTYYRIDKESLTEINTDDILELIDSLNELTVAFNGLEKTLNMKKPAAKSVNKIIKASDPDAVIGAFLKNMGW